jgi:hypothetical protein
MGAALTLLALPAPAQTSLGSLSSVLSAIPPEKIVAKRGATVDVPIAIQVKQGFHVNSDKPADEYLIPLKFTVAPGALELVEVVWPKPLMQKFAFSEKPLSVFEGNFKVLTRLKAGATPGASQMAGKLRYQACNDRMCLPPRTLDVKVPVEVR